MPEGDSIHHAAVRLRPVLLGGPLERVRTAHPRTRATGWEEQLLGRTVERVDARGKHLLIRFDGDLVLHSHLRMTGSWAVRGVGERWPRSARRAWLVLGRGDRDAIQFDGPVLQLRTATEVARDLRLRTLGPDICVDAPLDIERILQGLLSDDPTKPVGEALLNQRSVAGIGNVWKSEGCWAAQIDPARPIGTVRDVELTSIVEAIAPGIQRCAQHGTHLRPKHVYGRTGRPCSRCGTPILQRGLGDDNRTTFWCPGCQR